MLDLLQLDEAIMVKSSFELCDTQRCFCVCIVAWLCIWTLLGTFSKLNSRRHIPEPRHSFRQAPRNPAGPSTKKVIQNYQVLIQFWKFSEADCLLEFDSP
jgi:hypothetical protein